MSGTQPTRIVDATFFDTDTDINIKPTPGAITDPEDIHLTPARDYPMGEDDDPEEWPMPKLTSSYAHLNKAVDSSQITAQNTEGYSFLGLPTHPDDIPKGQALVPSLSIISTASSSSSNSSSFQQINLNTPKSGVLLGLDETTPRSRSKSRIISNPEEIYAMSKKVLERSGVILNEPDKDVMKLYVRLGRLSNFHHEVSAHKQILEMELHPSDIVGTLITKFKSDHPELSNENLVVYHNFKRIPNIAQTIENAHFKDKDIIELVSFNPNIAEWSGVKKALISSVILGFGVALFSVGFTFFDTFTRGLVCMTGFLLLFFSCVGMCIGTAETNVIHPLYYPTQSQTWNSPILN